ncbi:hypothetical protein TNCV_175731 [Trichonephila clavipes]|nr:hypothetical protein TNCV_175731 [Trichonephila clavipes]
MVQSSKNIIDADSDGENAMNNAASVPMLSEMRNIMKSVCSYSVAHSNVEMNNKMNDIEHSVDNSMLKKKIPESSELANMVAKDAKMAANLVDKNDANLVLPPRFRQVLIESPL